MTAIRKVKTEIKKNKKSKKKLDGTVKKGSKRKNVVVKKEAKVVKKKEKVKRKLYSTVDLQRAVNAVNHGTSVRKAALKYSVPPTSIHRAVKNPEQSNLMAGPAPILSTEVENEIVSWILYRAEKGYPITKTELLDSVQSYIRNLGDEIPKTPFTNDRPGRHWFEKFRLRHPEITIRTPQHFTMTLACVTEEDLRGWFSDIGVYLKNKGLDKLHPSRVFNCDETNVQLIPKSEKVLAKKGASSAYKIVDGGEKESLTALFMYSADGTRAPPMIMYKYADSMPANILKNCPAGWGIGNSDNGWMTTETFFEYIANVFYPWLQKSEVEFPIIIYLDGHSSHVTIPLVKCCREKEIEVIALFPNATHIMQPLDIAFFHPFKEVWRAAIAKYKAEKDISRLKKEHFPAVLEQALNSFVNEKPTIINGFKDAGLVPFDPEAVEYNVLHKKKSKKKKAESEKSVEHNLPDVVLQNFKETETIGVENQDTANNSLFQYWLEVKKAVGDAGKKSRSLIKSVEILNNHKLIVVPQTVPASTSFELMNESNLNVTNDPILIELDGIEDNELNALLNNESLESIIIETNSTIEHIVEHEHALPENLDTVISQKETFHESADMTNEPNDFQAISTVLID
ncbi:uncharacterized protein LOC116416491 [Nasonia vitripennis]|uniref:HTH CENPB-type domain-containing protein n=1 Tax=Nasonia vitripennis TaxID=7425 RepID=A0A7M7T7Y4_NASVI|nr:uncharacterized protein LOC116416491 [Nasonia vitripennis]